MIQDVSSTDDVNYRIVFDVFFYKVHQFLYDFVYIKGRTMTNDVTMTGRVPLLVTRVFTQAGTPSGIW